LQPLVETVGPGERIASNILADRLKRLAELGLVTGEDARAGQRARYRLTGPAIALVPYSRSSAVGTSPPAHALRVRAKLPEQGGPALWQAFIAIRDPHPSLTCVYS
jgi:hypothetical protein